MLTLHLRAVAIRKEFLSNNVPTYLEGRTKRQGLDFGFVVPNNRAMSLGLITYFMHNPLDIYFIPVVLRVFQNCTTDYKI